MAVQLLVLLVILTLILAVLFTACYVVEKELQSLSGYCDTGSASKKKNTGGITTDW